MSDTENLAAIYRRLQKILAIANDTRTDPGTAAAAASQAEKIMRKYQIEESDVLEKTLKAGGAELFSTFDMNATYNIGKPRNTIISQSLSILAVAIAKLNDTQAVSYTDQIFGKMLRFRGYKPDVEVSKFTFRYLVQTCIRAGRGETSLPDFRKGFMKAVVESLKKALEEKIADRVVDSRALVVIKKDAVTLHFGDPKYSQGRQSYSDREAADRGYEAGKKLDVLLRGVGHTQAPAAKALK